MRMAHFLSTRRLFEPRLWVAQTVQLAGAVTALWAVVAQVQVSWWLFALSVYFATSCLGMAVGVHRGICHRAFCMNRTLERVLSVFASIGMTGSPLGWVGTHRTHHAHADTTEDPHGPAYHGWKLLWSGPEPNIESWRLKDVLRDPFQRRLHRNYMLFVGVWVALLAMIHPLAVVFGFLVPASLQITTTNLSTILAHGHGYRNYETRDDSTNNLLVALLTWGEGWHNNHHARPRDWSMSKRWWEIDISSWCIRGFVAIGLIDRRSFFEPI
jgi:fatty-acid desaturase